MKRIISILFLMMCVQVYASNSYIAATGYCENARASSPIPNNGGGQCLDISSGIGPTDNQQYEINFHSCPSGYTPQIMSGENYYFNNNTQLTTTAAFYIKKQINLSSLCINTFDPKMQECILGQYVEVCTGSAGASTCTYSNLLSTDTSNTIGTSYIIICVPSS